MKVQWITIALLITSLGCGGTDDSAPTDAGPPPVDTSQPAPDTMPPSPDTTQPAPDVPACTPQCTGKQCGPDGCGSTCGTCPDNGSTCDAQGQCAQPTPTPPPTPTPTPPSGACTNAADQAIIDSKDVEEIAKTCGIGQYTGGPPAAQCIKGQTGLSDACIVCFEGTVECGVQCAGECLFAPDSPACDQCLEDKGCLAEFATCSGIPTTDD